MRQCGQVGDGYGWNMPGTGRGNNDAVEAPGGSADGLLRG